MWRLHDPQCNEAEKVMWDIVPYTRGRGIDVGCGRFKAFPHFIGVDNGHHWGREGIDVVSEADDLELFASESLDFVFSSHALEHIADFKGALREWWRVLKVGGHLSLYLPHKELYPNIGSDHGNKDHKHDFLPQDIIDAMRDIGSWELGVNERRDHDNGEGSRGNEYSFFQVYRKTESGQKIIEKVAHKKTCAVVRYGGFGDMIVLSSILPGLKAQGYHITIFTTPRGHDILRHDPHVDAFMLQDTDQVPNNKLGDFWKHHKAKYDKWVNLSESVEVTSLAFPGTTAFNWSHAARNLFFDKNYIEVTHAIAEVPMPAKAKFYPTPEETAWAKAERAKMGETVVLWSISGSAVHKRYSKMDRVMMMVLTTRPEVEFVLIGDELCQLLEAGWENEKRVHCRSGKWSIRETLAFANECDLVVGPETGVLNSVGMEEVPKVCMLSHSSEQNLMKHWKNAVALTPDNTPCFPCHQMHYGFETCKEVKEVGCAQCQEDIRAEDVFLAIVQRTDKMTKAA